MDERFYFSHQIRETTTEAERKKDIFPFVAVALIIKDRVGLFSFGGCGFGVSLSFLLIQDTDTQTQNISIVVVGYRE